MAILKYLSVRGIDNGPLFRSKDTPHQVNPVHQSLSTAGVDTEPSKMKLEAIQTPPVWQAAHPRTSVSQGGVAFNYPQVRY